MCSGYAAYAAALAVGLVYPDSGGLRLLFRNGHRGYYRHKCNMRMRRCRDRRCPEYPRRVGDAVRTMPLPVPGPGLHVLVQKGQLGSFRHPKAQL